MCIIIYKPAGQVLQKWVLRNSWQGNDDGAGFVYARDGKLVIVKELRKFKRFWKSYLAHCLDHVNVLLHFRIGTSGGRNIDNTHPFLVDEHHALVHNGILSCVKVPSFSPINDTQIFINEYMKFAVNDGDGGAVDWVNNDKAIKYVKDAIGASNKMAIINSSGQIAIINEDCGHWKDGCWFSNHSYEDSGLFTYYGGLSKGIDSYADRKQSAWERDWEDRWAKINDKPTELHDFRGNQFFTPAWPKSEDVSEYKDDGDMITDEKCLQCQALLSKSEMEFGYGVCEDCYHIVYEGV